MAYIFPTVDDFRAKFPEFADLDDETIQTLLDEAGRNVDETWTEGDYTNAILYLAAHYHQLSLMAANESGGTGTGEDASGVPAGSMITSEHIGPIAVSYGKSTSATSAGSSGSGAYPSPFGTTIYGQRYLDLLKKNIPAVLVI